MPDARTLRDDADYYDDFGSGVLLVPEGYKVADMLGATGKVVLPVEGLAFAFDAVYRADDELAQAVVGLFCGEKDTGLGSYGAVGHGCAG